MITHPVRHYTPTIRAADGYILAPVTLPAEPWHIPARQHVQPRDEPLRMSVTMPKVMAV